MSVTSKRFSEYDKGDWVELSCRIFPMDQRSNGRFRVIDSSETVLYCENEGGATSVSYGEDNGPVSVRPVPIDAEILRKSKFKLFYKKGIRDESHQLWTSYEKTPEVLYIIRILRTYGESMKGYFDICVKGGAEEVHLRRRFVHELQHIMRIFKLKKDIQL